MSDAEFGVFIDHIDVALGDDVERVARIALSEQYLAGSERVRPQAGQNLFNVFWRQVPQQIAACKGFDGLLGIFAPALARKLAKAGWIANRRAFFLQIERDDVVYECAELIAFALTLAETPPILGLQLIGLFVGAAIVVGGLTFSGAGTRTSCSAVRAKAADLVGPRAMNGTRLDQTTREIIRRATVRLSLLLLFALAQFFTPWGFAMALQAIFGFSALPCFGYAIFKLERPFAQSLDDWDEGIFFFSLFAAVRLFCQ